MTSSMHNDFKKYVNSINYDEIQLSHITRVVNLQAISNKVSNVFNKIVEDQKNSKMPDIAFSSYFESPGDILHDVTKFPLYIHIFSAILCLSWSAIYHLFYVHSASVSKVLARLDYAGISFLIGGSGVSPIYYSLYCSDGDFVRPLYLVITFVACFGTFIVTMVPKFDAPKYRSFRAILFVALGVASAYPMLQFVFFRNVETMPEYPVFLWAFGGAIYIFGAFIYSIRVPECLYPGKFDFFGHSHNLWHFFVLLAAITHYYGSLELYHLRRHFQCPA